MIPFMPDTLSIEQFITHHQKFPVVDVRTPTEFTRGHLPGATNIPLFSDEERAMVGTAYAQESKKAAILQGLDFVGPKMRQLLEQADTVVERNTLLFYCWRGGMRSQSLAWLGDLYGYTTYSLEGGYKTFRRYILDTFEQRLPLMVLGGKTGSGKTAILKALAQLGQQFVDLEGLAQHKGSAFGGLGQPCQPTQQQFENDLGMIFREVDKTQPVWIEDESRYVGQIILPIEFWRQKFKAPILYIDVPLELRVERLVQEYGQQSQAQLAASIQKIKQRLGGMETEQALNALYRDDYHTCCAILLEHYYDKAYLHSLERKQPKNLHHLKLTSLDPLENAKTILDSQLIFTPQHL